MKRLFFNAKTQRRKDAETLKNFRRKNLFFTISSFAPLRLCAFALILSAFVNAQSLPVAAPNAVGMSAERLSEIDKLVERDIADKKLPGAVVLIGRKGKIVYRKAFGNRSLTPTVEKMTVDTIFDVASLTKPIATATSIMILVERGQLRLNDTIGKFIPEIQDEDAKRVTIQQLLTHTSGYRPDFDLDEKWTGRDGMLAALYKEKLRNSPGTRFVYSDIGFIVLGEIVQRVDKQGFEVFARSNVFNKLSSANFDSVNFYRFFLYRSSSAQNIPGIPDQIPVFIPLPDSSNSVAANLPSKITKIPSDLSKIAPTENIKGQQNYLGSKFEGDEKTGNEMLRGRVHDPTAHRMGGVAGHAGLFSTADDLARYCQMLLNGGVLEGKRILSAQTIAKMTAPYVVSETGATRGLGWDMNSSFSANRGEFFPLGSFGHTGFTGTSVWIDPVSQTFVVFLSNRVHPNGKGDVTPLRAKVATVAASAIEDVPIEKFREAENVYSAQVAAQVANFKSQISNSQTQTTNNGQRTTNAVVLNGIDVLEKNNFKELENLKIGLVTNHTGKNLSGKPTIDVLKAGKNVRLVALFSPEHGIRGQLDQEKIVDSIDEKTGLPVYSLYGETRRPKPEQLRDLDAVVYDIQDIGTRFYTYISTLQNVMEEAAKAGKPVFVLDRPNPINGTSVAGAIADADKLTFVATHTLPVRHGMTVGEIAQMFNIEKRINADLRVVKMENWQRGMWFDQTNQTWTNPSPNMRSLTEATLYPGIGLLEYTNLSVGRGTDTPFEVVGAPWIDGRRLAAFLNERNLSGVRFVPVRYKPDASVFKNEEVGGVNIVVTDRERFDPVRTGIEIAVALRKLYPNDWKMEKYLNLIVNQTSFEQVKLGNAPEEIERAWQKDLDEFKKRRAQFLIYK